MKSFKKALFVIMHLMCINVVSSGRDRSLISSCTNYSIIIMRHRNGGRSYKARTLGREKIFSMEGNDVEGAYLAALNWIYDQHEQKEKELLNES